MLVSVTASKARCSEVLPLLLPSRPLSPYMPCISQPGTSPMAHQIPQAFAQKAEHSQRQKSCLLSCTFVVSKDRMSTSRRSTHSLSLVNSLSSLNLQYPAPAPYSQKTLFFLISLRKLKLSGKVLKFLPTLPVTKFCMPMSISPPEHCLTCSLLLQLAASPPSPHHAQHTPSAHGSSSGKTHPRPS